jgi:hypothetical protein
VRGFTWSLALERKLALESCERWQLVRAVAVFELDRA